MKKKLAFEQKKRIRLLQLSDMTTEASAISQLTSTGCGLETCFYNQAELLLYAAPTFAFWACGS